MPYEVYFDEQDKIVRVRILGKASKYEHISARDEAFQLCRENQSTKVLVDLRNLNTEKSTTTGCYGFGESVAQADISSSTRIAHVLPTDPEARKNVEFTVTVEANRGRNVRQFDTVEEAKKWLLEE